MHPAAYIVFLVLGYIALSLPTSRNLVAARTDGWPSGAAALRSSHFAL